MTRRGARGQSLLEVAMVLPVLLAIFAGLYVASRTGFLASRAQSAAQAEALRAGRGMRGIERKLAEQVLPADNAVFVGSEARRSARLLPPPFPALVGRSSGVVSLNKEWTETGAIGGFSPLALARKSDLSADCWGANSRSGRNIRGIIRARIATGVIW